MKVWWWKHKRKVLTAGAVLLAALGGTITWTVAGQQIAAMFGLGG